MAGNTKAWLGTSSVKEISFSGHTHSGYASSSHTHTGYAASNHTHSQYVTEVDISQMIENAIDSYVPTITSLGQIGTGSVNNKTSFSITVSPSAKLVIMSLFSNTHGIYTLMTVKLNGSWVTTTCRVESRYTLILEGSSTTITFSIGSTTTIAFDLRYCYF